MDEQSAKQFLGIPATTGTGSSTNTPMTDAVMAAALPPEGTKAMALAEQDKQQFVDANQEPGAPLDIDSGASPWERMMLSFRRERDNQVAYLQKSYGKDNVRVASDGGLIVRVMDSDTGKPKDVLVDEHNMSAKDFIDVLGVAPEIAGGIYAMRKGQASPFLKKASGAIAKTVRDAATTALGAEGVGLVKDVGANVVDRGVLDLEKTAAERGKMAAIDFGVGMASYPAARFLKLMENPLAPGRGKVQFDALEAQKYFNEKYGVDVPLSIGESTGSPLASRTEVFLEKMPGASTPFNKLKGEQETALRKLQSMMMGKLPESDEAIGNRLIAELQGKMAPLETAVESARSGLEKHSGSQIEGMISGLTMPERQLYKTAVGKDVRSAVVGKRDAAKVEADRLYGVAKELPGGTGKVFPADDLSKEASGILKKLPSKQGITERIDYDAYGSPILRTDKGETVMKEFVPPNILARLNELASLKGQKMSLSDLQQMRREVYDDIAKGEGVPGIGTHYLADIGKSLTKAIDDGVTALPTGELKTALQAANAHYKDKVIPFNRLGITELFRAADEAGHMSDSEIVSRVFSGGRAAENYKLIKETIGEKSAQFVKLKRAVADNILESSRLPGGETIDAASFINNLRNFRLQNREIADDVFGDKINKLFKEAEFLDFAKGRRPLIGAYENEIPKHTQIAAEDLQALLKEKSPSAEKLRELMKAETARNDAYKTTILKDVQRGKLTGELNPEDFVNRFLDQSTPTQVSKVMGMIGDNPALVEDVKAKVIEKLFRDASRSATPKDISQLMAGDPTRIVSGTSVFKQIENPSVRKKIESVLGPEVFKDLEQYIKLEATTEAKETSFKAAGGIAAGAQIADLTRRGPLQYLYGSAKDFVVANLLTRQPLRGWLTSVPTSEPGMVYALLSNPTFIQAVTKEFGEGTAAEAFISAIKQSVDKWTGEQAGQATENKAEGEREKMLQFLNSQPSSLTPAPAQ